MYNNFKHDIMCFVELPTVTMASTYAGQINQPFKLVCKVESLVPFTVRWYKDGSVKTKALAFK